MHYFWNIFISPYFDVNIGVGQGLALFAILLALYLLSFFHILENHLKILKILISTLSFVDNSLPRKNLFTYLIPTSIVVTMLYLIFF